VNSDEKKQDRPLTEDLGRVRWMNPPSFEQLKELVRALARLEARAEYQRLQKHLKGPRKRILTPPKK
jgi:hypothetical protein